MKTIEEIYQQLTARFEELTGVSALGEGDLAVRFYAVAAELYSLYVQGEWVRGQCFPQTATGDNLDLHGGLRGVSRRGAEYSRGVIRFWLDEVREEDVVVECGTVCLAGGEIRFETVEDGVIPAGELYTDVEARAAEAGEAGNVGAGTILNMAVAPTAVSSCINPAPFSGGCDRESDQSLRQRVLETYARLANGANAAYYRQTALSFEEVEAAQVIPRSRGIGTVDVVVATREGVPDEELLNRIGSHIQSMREIAVDVAVLAPETVEVNVALSVKGAEGADTDQVAALAEEKVRSLFTGALLGCSVLTAQLTALIFGLDGVANCTVTLPEGDVEIGATQLPVLGELTVTVV